MYDEMLEPGKRLELKSTVRGHPTLKCRLSTEFMAYKGAALRLRCFKWSLRRLSSAAGFINSCCKLPAKFRRWPFRGRLTIVPIGKRGLTFDAHSVQNLLAPVDAELLWDIRDPQ